MERSAHQSTYQSSSFLFVGGLSLEASAKDIGTYFEKFGRVLKVDLPLNKGGQRKGFGFVHFSNSESIQEALACNCHQIRGKRVAVRKGLDNNEASAVTKEMQERKIYASGFPSHATEEYVFSYFSNFGKVSRILSPKGGIGERGFCYIIMKETQDFDYLCDLGCVKLDHTSISLVPAQIKSKVKEACKSKGSKNESRRGSFNPSSSEGSQRTIPARPGVESAREQVDSARTIQMNRPSAFASNLNVNPQGVSMLASRIGSNNMQQQPARKPYRDQTAVRSWYTPFNGVDVNSFYQFSDRFKAKHNLTNIADELVGLQGDDVEVEIVQDISTTVTIRNPKGQTAVRATYNDQNTYTGIF